MAWVYFHTLSAGSWVETGASSSARQGASSGQGTKFATKFGCCWVLGEEDLPLCWEMLLP